MKMYLNVLKIAKTLNISVVHKPKRNIGNRRTKAYKKLLTDLSKFENYIPIDPKFNAYSLIINAEICISQPFTSTGLMAKYFNKNSIFYDPLKLMSANDPAKRDVKFINNFVELKNYINNKIKSFNN